MSKRKVHRIKCERKRLWGKPMWYVYCTAGDWFQWLFDKSEAGPLGDQHLERVRTNRLT